jgi:ABC-type polysaccharide/polyol phosphate export permease
MNLIAAMRRNRELIWCLALKELRVRYKRSVLGFVWALLNPLMMMAILTVVFSNLARLPIKQYAVFLISALLPWTFFSQALTYCTESIVGNGPLLKKVRVDSAVFPVAAVLSNIFNFLFSLAPLVLILLVLRFPFYWTWLYLPVAMIPLMMFALGLGFYFATVNVFFRDVSHIVQILLSGWFYLCPIMYSFDFLPQKYHTVFRLNPMLYILNGFRLAIYYGQLPSAASMLTAFSFGAIALTAGYFYFRSRQDTFIFYT